MDASISLNDGTLVIDFKNVRQKTMYRDVVIAHSANGSITLTAKEVISGYFDDSRWSHRDSWDPFNEKNIEAVLPEYLEDVLVKKIPWYNRPLLFGNDPKIKVDRIVKRVINGWVEFKVTNKPVIFTTSVYLIKNDNINGIN